MKNKKGLLRLVDDSRSGRDRLFTEERKGITLNKMLHSPPFADNSQTKRAVILLWGFNGMSMWGTSRIRNDRKRWAQFIHFAESSKCVLFKPGEEITLAKIFGLPDCVETPKFTMRFNDQLEIILLLI